MARKKKKDKEKLKYLEFAIKCNARNRLSGCGYMAMIYESDYCSYCRYYTIGCYRFDKKPSVI